MDAVFPRPAAGETGAVLCEGFRVLKNIRRYAGLLLIIIFIHCRP